MYFYYMLLARKHSRANTLTILEERILKFVKYKIENQELQDKEVTDGGMMEQKWHDFTYDQNNPLIIIYY